MLSPKTLQRYEKKERAEAGLALLKDAGIEARLSVSRPATVYASLTPDARVYSLEVAAADIQRAHLALYRQEPAEKPEKVWQFREKGAGRRRSQGLRSLVLGGSLVAVSLAIAAGIYLFADMRQLILPLTGGAAGVLLMVRGWFQVRK